MAASKAIARRSSAKGIFSKLGVKNVPVPIKIILYAGAAYLGYRLVMWIKKKLDEQAVKSELQGIVSAQVAPGLNLATSAYGIHDAFYNNDMFGMTEDEEGAIKFLLQIPDQYVMQLAQEYAKIEGNNMFNDFRRFLDSSDYQRVKAKLDSGLVSAYTPPPPSAIDTGTWDYVPPGAGILPDGSFMSDGSCSNCGNQLVYVQDQRGNWVPTWIYDEWYGRSPGFHELSEQGSGRWLGIGGILFGSFLMYRGYTRDRWLPMALGATFASFGVARLAGWDPDTMFAPNAGSQYPQPIPYPQPQPDQIGVQIPQFIP